VSDFSEQFESSAVPSLMDYFGVAAVYAPKGGAEVTLTVLAGHETVSRRSSAAGDAMRGAPLDHGRQKHQRRLITIAVDPEGPYGGVAEPRTNDTLTLSESGLKYAIEGITAPQHGFAQLICVRIAEAEISRPKLRGRR
jgi:hypothetical protein